MILRRVIEHFRKQEWTAVFLDFLIVVAGVFVGLQANNWNEAQHEKRLERSYVERLEADVAGAVEDQRSSQAWNEERVATQQVVLDALRAGRLEPAQRAAFARGLALAGVHNPLRWRWGTVKELYATGNIAVLRDAGLRSALAGAESYYERGVQIVAEAQSQIAVSRGQITQYYDTISTSLDPGGEAEVRYDFDALAQNPQFIAAFSNLQVNSVVITGFAREHLKFLENLEAKIAAARGAKRPSGASSSP